MVKDSTQCKAQSRRWAQCKRKPDYKEIHKHQLEVKDQVKFDEEGQ